MGASVSKNTPLEEYYAPAGHEFHTSSFTLPIDVSGSKDIVRRFPEMSKKVRYV